MAPRKGQKHSGQWDKGVSGNPGGKPKLADGWRESLRNDETLRVEILKLAKGEQSKANADHLKYLLDQGFGRAPQEQKIEIDIAGEARRFISAALKDDDAAAAILAELEKNAGE